MFEREREFFTTYRDRLKGDEELIAQVEAAFLEMHDRYDTKIWENRFVAGGLTEQIIGSSARALGIDVANAGKHNQGYDLELPSREGISIKGSFASTSGQIRLINNLGRGSRAWADGTLFPMAGIGIGYADPDLCPGFTSQSGDALVLSGKRLKNFWIANPGWLVEFVNIPPKSTSAYTAVASDVVAFEMFQRYPRLRDNFKAEI